MGLHIKYPSFLFDVKEALISRQIIEEYSDIIFHENPSSGSRVVSCGQTDRRDEANSRSSQF
jgi:hypothetical protein